MKLLLGLSLAIGTSCALDAPGASNELTIIQLKQGCTILCPQEFKPLDSENIQATMRFVEEELKKLRPKLKVQPKAMQAVLVAVDNPEDPKRQVQLLLGPPEMSQAELKAMPPADLRRLKRFMFENLKPIFKRVEISVTKELESKIVVGMKLTYFLLAYEFTDSTKVPQISLRAYYYTKTATFILGFSCDREYYQMNEAKVRRVLGSLGSSED